MKKVKVKCGCKDCKGEAKFFHSKCCIAHFEGVLEGDEVFIVCEKCGKYVANCITNPNRVGKTYKIK